MEVRPGGPVEPSPAAEPFRPAQPRPCQRTGDGRGHPGALTRPMRPYPTRETEKPEGRPMREDPAMSERAQTWHHGLVAKWWSEFNVDGPEIEYFRRFVEQGEPALDV